MSQKRGAKRVYDKDGNGRILVDCMGLANMILRRCDGCPPEEHYRVAARFLSQQQFPDDVRRKVFEHLDSYLQRRRTPYFTCADSQTLCRTCQRPIGTHPQDREVPWLTVLCDERRVKVR